MSQRSECWTHPFGSQSEDALLPPHFDTEPLHSFPVRPVNIMGTPGLTSEESVITSA